MLNRKRLGSGRIEEGQGRESMSLRGQHDMNDELPGVRLGDQETRGTRGGRNRTKAGMSVKQKEISIYHRPINVLGNRAVGGFRAEGSRRNKPNGPKIRCSNQIQEFRPKQTQPSYLPCSLPVTAEMGPLFSKFECERSIKDSGPGGAGPGARSTSFQG
jgi:hypothetical protein